MTKNMKLAELKKKDCILLLEYTNFTDNLIEYKCLYCNSNYKKCLMKS